MCEKNNHWYSVGTGKSQPQAFILSLNDGVCGKPDVDETETQALIPALTRRCEEVEKNFSKGSEVCGAKRFFCT